MYNEYFNRLSYKYNYDNNIIKKLQVIIPVMIDYYGDEYREQILQRIENCKIHIKEHDENPNQYISRELGIVDNYIKKDNIDGYATTRHKLINGNVEEISLIYLSDNFETNEQMISTLVHELCHIIKHQPSQLNEDGVIINKTGAQTNFYSLNGVLLSQNFVDLEETINSYDEKQIMKKIYFLNDYTFESIYGLAALRLEELIDIIRDELHFDFRKLLIEDELLSKQNLEYFFGAFGKCTLNNLFSQYIKLADLLNNKEKLIIQKQELDAVFNLLIQSFYTMCDNYTLFQVRDSESKKASL